MSEVDIDVTGWHVPAVDTNVTANGLLVQLMVCGLRPIQLASPPVRLICRKSLTDDDSGLSPVALWLLFLFRIFSIKLAVPTWSLTIGFLSYFLCVCGFSRYFLITCSGMMTISCNISFLSQGKLMPAPTICPLFSW